MGILKWVFFSVKHLLWKGRSVIYSSTRTRDTHNCCRAFGNVTVTKCFNDLGLSRKGIAFWSEANALPLDIVAGFFYSKQNSSTVNYDNTVYTRFLFTLKHYSTYAKRIILQLLSNILESVWIMKDERHTYW